MYFIFYLVLLQVVSVCSCKYVFLSCAYLTHRLQKINLDLLYSRYTDYLKIQKCLLDIDSERYLKRQMFLVSYSVFLFLLPVAMYFSHQTIYNQNNSHLIIECKWYYRKYILFYWFKNKILDLNILDSFHGFSDNYYLQHYFTLRRLFSL